MGQSVGGKSGSVVGAGVGGAAGAVVGKNIDSGSGSATGTAPRVEKGSVTVVQGAPPRTVVTYHVYGDDDSCGKKSKHWNHPGKGYAKGHYKKNC